MARRKTPLEGYGSARDLPSLAELMVQLQGAKLVTLVIARDERKRLLKIEADLRAHINTVDQFYRLLGPRNWIFHDSLNMPLAESLLSLPADKAERRLIDFYCDPDQLRFLVGQLGRFEELRIRHPLIERAQTEYLAGRYDTCVALLLSVMDGFVNDIDRAQRRGLHARGEDEMVAWDSVVGHHMGLKHAHQTFTRQFKKTSTDIVHELYRNGIVHGMLINYDNDIVASKAWNRLFAVADWASSQRKQATPPKARASWSQMLSQLDQNRRARASLDAWRPSSAEAGQKAFEQDEVVEQSRRYLDAWRKRNFGDMASLLHPLLAEETPGKTAGMVREAYQDEMLLDFHLDRVSHEAASVTEVDVTLIAKAGPTQGRLRWVRTDPTGNAVVPDQLGSWGLMSWTRTAMQSNARTNVSRRRVDDPPPRTRG